jgi:plasmid stability protein
MRAAIKADISTDVRQCIAIGPIYGLSGDQSPPLSGLSGALATTNAMIAGGSVASITIRNLDDALEHKLRLRAADRNRSMEDEARDILRTALAQEPADTKHLIDAMRELVEPFGGVDLELPPRGPIREPPDFK